jgi:hypothetical protein
VRIHNVQVNRVVDFPMITPSSDSSIGTNIQGPSVIKVPEWIKNPLGAYYLYFADHKGSYIRLAYADNPLGPWAIYSPGSLQLSESCFLTEAPEISPEMLKEYELRRQGAAISHDLLTEISTPHIASPDVIVDSSNKLILMYFHGLESAGNQVSRLAFSDDGISFRARSAILGRTYMRVFKYEGETYALSMPGQVYKSANGQDDFKEGPLLFNPNMRHSAVLVRDNVLLVFWTQVGDIPESILLSRIDLTNHWMDWQAEDAIELLHPEFDWEGANAPLVPSVRSTAYGHVNQLRDPAILANNDEVFLYYAIAGESGIAVVKIEID